MLPWTSDGCRTAALDRDLDGLDDACELALAQAFAPEMVVDPRDCSWDASAPPGRLGGGYLFAVQGVPDGRTIRVAYLPGYYRDCGWEGLPCLTRAAGCSAHDGDSEIVVVQVRYDPTTARWLTDAVFLSAHCFGRSDGRCRWYEADELRQFAWSGTQLGAPRVWVAKGKHGNYPSPGACDSGHWYYDSCDRNTAAYRFPVLVSAQNIGSRRRPLPERDGAARAGCLTAAHLVWSGAAPNTGTHECFWDPSAPFHGWQRLRGRPATPYATVLRFAAEL
jgi:hypothetical protein